MLDSFLVLAHALVGFVDFRLQSGSLTVSLDPAAHPEEERAGFEVGAK